MEDEKVGLDKDKKEENEECGGRPWLQVAARVPLPAALAPTAARLHRHLRLVHFQCTVHVPILTSDITVLHCNSLDNKRKHYVLNCESADVQICNVLQ